MTIDWWTLGIQTVNVVILIWLLQRFFWRPVAAMIEQRRAQAKKTLDDATTKDKQATDKLAEIEVTRAGFAKERDAILADANNVAQQARDASHKQDAADSAAAKEAARAAIAQNKVAADKAWNDHAGHLAVEIAQRLLARLDDTTVKAAFLPFLLEEIRKQPDQIGHAVTEGGQQLEATSAKPLDTAEQDHYSALIGDALGSHPGIVFKTDATLIAGLELSGPNFLVTNSWRADLAQILADMTNGT